MFFPTSFQKRVLKGLRLKCMQFLSEAVATYCDCSLALANRHPQSCSVTEIEGGCTCSEVCPISVACCKKVNSINILQHCPSDFVAELTPGDRHATFWFHNLQIRKKCFTSKVKMSHMKPRLARLFLTHRSTRIYIILTIFFGLPEAFKV